MRLNPSLKLIAAVVICCTIASCKKKPGEEPVPAPEDKPVTAPHGKPIGDILTKSIGSSGGTIELPNSAIKVIVPAGAVDTETTFSLQRVENTLSTNSANASYRLLPENINFKKDIEIFLPYTEANLAGTSEDALSLAYQDREGVWHPAKDVTINKGNKLLSVKTRHFSDWSIYARFTVKTSHGRLYVGEKAELQVRVYDMKSDDDELYLLADGELVPNANVEGWKILYGSGSLSGGPAAKQTLTAPNVVTQPSETLVQVDVKNDQGVKLYVGAVSVWIVPRNYILWNVAGHTEYSTAPNFGRDTFGGFWVNALGQSGNVHFVVNEFKIGSSEFGLATSLSILSQGSNWIHYTSCQGNYAYLPGTIEVNSITGYLTGEFSGTLSKKGLNGPVCNAETKYAKGSFSIKLP